LAVHFLHEHKIVHRDLKPTNILVNADMDPKILDFGLAQHVGSNISRVTRPGEIIGTPDYFSPEHTLPGSRFDPRSDVFSLGTILYELLTGSPPFHGETFGEQVRLIREQDPALRRDYARLVEREDSWILNARRLSLPQVSLYLGAWILTVGAALLFLFQFADLSGTLGVIVVAGAAALMADRGLRLWKSGQLRI